MLGYVTAYTRALCSYWTEPAAAAAGCPPDSPNGDDALELSVSIAMYRLICTVELLYARVVGRSRQQQSLTIRKSISK